MCRHYRSRLPLACGMLVAMLVACDDPTSPRDVEGTWGAENVRLTISVSDALFETPCYSGRLTMPFQFGEETSLIEMPISWSLDDHPHFEFIRTPQTVSPGLQPARAVMQSWLDEFVYMKRTVAFGVLTYTMHPYVIGRGYRMLALDWLVERLAHEGAVFMAMEDAAREAKERLFA